MLSNGNQQDTVAIGLGVPFLKNEPPSIADENALGHGELKEVISIKETGLLVPI